MIELSIITEIFLKFEGAFAKNTLRKYRADFEQFCRWCNDQQINPLVASGQNFADFVDELAKSSLASRTIISKISSISCVLTLAGFENPTKVPVVVLALKRMRRQKGHSQTQATPLTKEVLAKLLTVTGRGKRGLRNQVLLRLGYETMRRRDEICHFTFEDLIRLPNGKTAIQLRRSKTDPYGLGKLIPISDELYRLIKKWQRYATGGGRILRSISRTGVVGQKLSATSLNEILKDLQHAARLNDLDELTGHSFRVGKALDLLDEGESLDRIMLIGGWSSQSSALRYLRSWHSMTHIKSTCVGSDP